MPSAHPAPDPTAAARAGSADPDPAHPPGVEFSIAILCYQAEEEIIPFIERLHGVMSLFRFEWEMVLVANYWPGRADRTPAIVSELSQRLDRVVVVARPKEGAMGWDMRCGLEACRGRFIGVIDGDGQFPLEAIFACFARIRSCDVDLVKTHRVQRKDGLWRSMVSRSYNGLFRLLFPAYRGYHDVNSKPKILRRDAYERMRLVASDWFIDAEIVLEALRLDLRIYELPVRFESLRKRRSFVRVGAVAEFTRNLLRAWRARAGSPHR